MRALPPKQSSPLPLSVGRPLILSAKICLSSVFPGSLFCSQRNATQHLSSLSPSKCVVNPNAQGWSGVSICLPTRAVIDNIIVTKGITGQANCGACYRPIVSFRILSFPCATTGTKLRRTRVVLEFICPDQTNTYNLFRKQLWV